MKQHKSKITWILLAFAAIYLVWGSTYAVVRVVVQTLPPYLMAGARYLLGGVILYGVLRLGGRSAPGWRAWKGPCVAGVLMLGGAHGLVCWAVQSVDSSVAAILMATGPMWMVVLEWLGFGGRRPGGWTVVGLALGVAGVVLISGLSTGGPMLGVLAVAAAAPLWSLGALAMRQLDRTGDTLLTSAQAMLVGGASLVLVGLIRGELAHVSLASLDAGVWVAFVYLVVLGSTGAYVAYGWLLGRVGAASVSTHAFVNPVVAMAVGHLWLGEVLTTRGGLGAVLVVLAVIIVVRRPSATPRPETQPASGQRQLTAQRVE